MMNILMNTKFCVYYSLSFSFPNIQKIVYIWIFLCSDYIYKISLRNIFILLSDGIKIFFVIHSRYWDF